MYICVLVIWVRYTVKHIFIMWNYLVSLPFILLNQCLQRLHVSRCDNMFPCIWPKKRGLKITEFVLKDLFPHYLAVSSRLWSSLRTKTQIFSSDECLIAFETHMKIEPCECVPTSIIFYLQTRSSGAQRYHTQTEFFQWFRQVLSSKYHR